MNKIPIAEEIVNKWAMDNGDLLHDAAIEALKEFANIHREEILKAAAKSAKAVIVNAGYPPDFIRETPKKAVVDEDSILSAYPRENIK